MSMRPVKVLPDLQTQKQIIKVDAANNLLFNVSGTLNNGHVSSSLPLTASDGLLLNVKTSTDTQFNNINILTSSYGVYKVYDVNDAFHAVDDSISSISSVNISKAYKRLRFQTVGNFDVNGSADITLPLIQFSGDAFPVSSIDYINVSVAIKENGSWYNDIVAVNITSSGGEVHVIIDAPALNSSNQYRLIATNENQNNFVI